MSEASSAPMMVVETSEDTMSVPWDAASLIILDRTRKGHYVLMGKRHERHVFMPDTYVFPGGRLEACDSEMVVAGALHSAAERKLMALMDNPSPLTARALALAAIRETFEETGHLIGSTNYGAPEETPDEWRAFAQYGVFPELDALHFVARAITPPLLPRRFDARFFVTEASNIARTVEGAYGPDQELVELIWVRLDDAASLNMPSITRLVMASLEQRLAAGFRQEAPVPLFRMDISKPSDEL